MDAKWQVQREKNLAEIARISANRREWDKAITDAGRKLEERMARGESFDPYIARGRK